MTSPIDRNEPLLRGASARWRSGDDTLQVLTAVARGLASEDPAATVVTAQFLLDLDSVPIASERRFRYRVMIVKTTFCGCAMLPRSEARGRTRSLVGTDLRRAHSLPRQLHVAAWDAVAASAILSSAGRSQLLRGPSGAQAALRAKCVVDEVDRVARRCRSRGACRVALIGFSLQIYRALTERGYDVHVSDLDVSLSAPSVPQQRMRLGERSAHSLLASTDIAVITGMTIANGTLDSLLRRAADARRGVVVYAETGHALLSLLPRLGIVDSVVSEPFPFYIFGATTRIVVHRKGME